MLFSGRLSLRLRLLFAALVVSLSLAMIVAGYDKVVAGFLHGMGLFGAAVAGAFYTLGATTPFAMAVILDLAKFNGPLEVMLISCAVAATVDCALFSLMREALEKSAKKIVKRIRERFGKISPAFPVAGFFVFGLPLPDELGLALMEFTEIRVAKLWTVIFLAKLVTLAALMQIWN